MAHNVYGRITMSCTNEPIPRARVTLYDKDFFQDEKIVHGYTDFNGNYSLSYSQTDWDWYWGNNKRPDIYIKVEKPGLASSKSATYANFYGTKRINLKIHSKYIKINEIYVGALDEYTTSERNRVGNAISVAREILSRVGIHISYTRYKYYTGTDEQYETIDNSDEASELRQKYSVKNNNLDMFIVRMYVGSTLGSSPVNGACNKTSKGRDGIVVEYWGDEENAFGLTIAHEIGHYLGLEHDSSMSNFMYENNNVVNTGITSQQGAKMKDHCFVRGC